MANPSSPAHHEPHFKSRSAAPALSIVAFCLLLAATLYAVIRHGAAPRSPRTPADIAGPAAQGPAWPSTSAETAGELEPVAEPAAPPSEPPAGERSPASEPVVDPRAGGSFTAPAVPSPPDAGTDAMPDASPAESLQAPPPPASAAPALEGGVADDSGPEAVVACGAKTCAPGEVCCNESCGTCVAPGQTCSKAACGMPFVPSSQSCGKNTCNVGEVCCNPSCGICAAPGEACDQRRCSDEIQLVESQWCGMQTCDVGFVCCNPSCGTCTRPGEECSHEPCA